MKNKLFRVLSLCLLAVLMVGAVLPAYAAAKPSIRGTRVLWIGTGKCAVLLDNLPEDASDFKISSTKKSIIKVGKDSNDAFGMWMKPLKAGNSTVKITYKSGGMTCSVSAKYKAKKYPKPFAWIKADGKKLNLNKNKVMGEVNGFTKKSVKVDFKLNSGWKVSKLTGMKFNMDGNKSFTWKKNKAVTVPDMGTVVFSILLKNKKNGDTFEYLVMVNR